MMTPSPANVSYFLECSAENYYGIQNEPSGYWLGSGCHDLGLLGTARENEISNLAAGYSPLGDKPLVQMQGYQGRQRQPGWDLTFNAPKSVSVLWGTSDADQREKISQFHAEAIGEAFQFLEENGAFTRRRVDGDIQFERAKLVAVAFEHASSRNLDPHLHSHVVVLNVGIRPDGTSGAVVSKPFWTLQKSAGAIYRASLSHKILENEIDGLRQGDNSFELKSVTPEAIGFWSTRRKEILDHAKEQGARSLKEFDLVTYQTRSDKASIERAELFQSWQAICQQQRFQFQSSFDPKLSTKQIRTICFNAVANTIGRLESKQSHFSYDQILWQSLREIEHRGIEVKHVVNSIQTAIAAGQLVHLGTHQEKSHYSTPHLLNQENRLVQLVTSMKNQVHVFRELGTAPEQMIKNIVTDNFERAEKSMIVTLTSGGAAESNRKFGVESLTAAKLLMDPGRLEDANLVVSNPSAFNTQQLISICEYARKSNNRIQFIDRKKQVHTYGPKGAFELVRSVVDKTNHYHDSEDRQPVPENVYRFPFPDVAAQNLAVAWNNSSGSIHEKQISVTDPSVVPLVNELCQSQLNKKRDTSQFTLLGSGEKAFAGDLVRFMVDFKGEGIQSNQPFQFQSISLLDKTIELEQDEKRICVPIRCLRFAKLGFAESEFQLREANDSIRFALIDSSSQMNRQVDLDDDSQIFEYNSDATPLPSKQSTQKIDILDLLNRAPVLDHQSATGLKQQLQQGI